MNQAAFNPIFVDTAPFVWQPNALGQPNIASTKLFKVVWSKMVSVGDHATIMDAFGNQIWDAEAYEPNFQQETCPGFVNGWQVTRLDSGVLQLYIVKC